MTTDDKKRKRRGERDDGRILVTLAIGRADNGRIIRKYFYGRTRKEAEKNRDEYKRKMQMGLSVKADEMTLDQWIAEWYKRYRTKVNPEYEKNYYIPIKRLSDRLGYRLIRSIVEADLYAALDEVSDMSSSTIEKYYSVIRQIFGKAKKNKIIQDDPSEDLEMPDGTSGSHRALERWETDCIMTHWTEHRAGLWAMLMLFCGLRRGEMAALQWENIDMKNRTLKVTSAAVFNGNKVTFKPHTKTDAGMRTIPICSALWEALNAVPVERRTAYVCVSSQGQPLTQSAYARGWQGFNLAMQRILNGEPPIQQGKTIDLEEKIARRKADGKEYRLFRVRAHDLRHTFATALYDAGVPVKAAQYYLGHSDVQVTMDLYTHLSKEREAVERSKMVNFLDSWLDKSALKGRIEP